MYGDFRNSDTKSDIFKEFDKYVEPSTSRPQSTAEVVDGAVVVQAVLPQGSNSSEQYCRKDFAGYILRFQQQGLARIDVIFNVYLEQSIKSATRSKWGQGKRIKVVKGTPLPRNWKFFLRVRQQDKTVSFASRGTGHRNRFQRTCYRGNLALLNSSELNKTLLA